MYTLFKRKITCPILSANIRNKNNSALINLIFIHSIRTPIPKRQQQPLVYVKQNQNLLLEFKAQYFASLRHLHAIAACRNNSNRILAKSYSKMSKGVRFEGAPDRFNGVTVDSQKEYSSDNFEDKLKSSLDFWIESKKRAIWFKVHPEHSEWVPVLMKNNFNFHHVKNGYVMLYRWLPEDQYENLPVYAHTMVGVGGLVVNMEKREVLVVTDRFAAIPGSWKLPGGYVEPGEDLVDAAIREVLEETSISSAFRTVVSLRHTHGGGYGCSDLYVVVGLIAKSFEPKACEREIARVSWLPFDEYLEHPNVHETNRHFLRTFLDYEKRGIRFNCKKATHQILKKEYCLYDIEPIENAEDNQNCQ